MKQCQVCKCNIPRNVYAETRARQGLNTRVECRVCGTSYSDGERIGPRIYPIDTHCGLRYSPWRVYYTRPVVPGWYETRFYDIEPKVLKLWWDGSRFTLADGRPIAMETFMGWRGVWRDS
jgi:hypothetical protein